MGGLPRQSVAMNISIPRSPWPDNFPDVVLHGNLQTRDKHPNLSLAKAGSAEAALDLVHELLSDTATDYIAELLKGRTPVIIPVAAIETTGFNAIPDAMMQELSERLNLPMFRGEIIQANKVAHTRSNGWHRLVTPATFAGKVEAGAEYLLVDDHVGFGGTLANLRGYIEVNGGQVLAMTALTETGGGKEIAVRSETLSMLRSKHGYNLDQFWRSIFTYGLDCLTNIEAGYLYRVESVDVV